MAYNAGTAFFRCFSPAISTYLSSFVNFNCVLTPLNIPRFPTVDKLLNCGWSCLGQGPNSIRQRCWAVKSTSTAGTWLLLPCASCNSCICQRTLRFVVVMMLNIPELFHFAKDPHVLLLVAGTQLWDALPIHRICGAWSAEPDLQPDWRRTERRGLTDDEQSAGSRCGVLSTVDFRRIFRCQSPHSPPHAGGWGLDSEISLGWPSVVLTIQGETIAHWATARPSHFRRSCSEAQAIH